MRKPPRPKSVGAAVDKVSEFRGESNASSPGRECDVCIVGGGPAGLNAALMLGRCRRRVLVFDSGKPRNAASRGLHGYLTRDGIAPRELVKLGRAEIERYPTVELHDVAVVDAHVRDGRFHIELATGRPLVARAMLLATGRTDVLPSKPGFAELYGRGVYHCPFCDGWEHRDESVVAFGRGAEAFDVALELLTWTRQVTLCSDGPCELTKEQRRRLGANGIDLREDIVNALEAGNDGGLSAVQFARGTLPCRALFFVSACPQKSSLPENLGCDFDESGSVVCDGSAATNVPGLFVAGNVRCGLHFAITAAAEGAEAAVAINDFLLEQDLC